MAQVMIKCPKTGEAVPISMDLPSLTGIVIVDGVLATCSQCGKSHIFQTEDMFLRQDTDND